MFFSFSKVEISEFSRSPVDNFTMIVVQSLAQNLNFFIGFPIADIDATQQEERRTDITLYTNL